MLKKKWLVLLMLSLSGSAFASFNPFDVFNASSSGQNAQGSGANSSQSQNPVPTAAASVPSQPASAPSAQASSAPSPYVQSSALVAPATAKNAKLVAPTTQPAVAPTNPLTAKNSAITQPPRLGQPLPANHPNSSTPLGLPGSLGANTNPANNFQPQIMGFDSVLKVLNTINDNMQTWKQQDDQNKVGAGAQLIPTTPQNLQNFLLNQSGLGGFLNSSFVMQNILRAQKQRLYGALTDGSNLQTDSTLLLLTPLAQADVSQVSAQLSSSSSSAVLSRGLLSNRLSDRYASSYATNFTALGDSPNWGALYGLMGYAILQVASQTKLVSSGSDSIMASLQTAVNAPFAKTQGQGSLTWLQQLQTSSAPQVLRMLAILLAESNQMRYIQLQNQQTMMVLQVAQMGEVAAENQRLQQLIQGQTQTNDLLLKISQQILAYNSKK